MSVLEQKTDFPFGAFALRDYQFEAVDEVRARLQSGQRRIMLCAPTGSGKTIIAADMMQTAICKDRRVLFLCDLTALVGQTSRRLNEASIPHGVIMSDYPPREWEPVQVASAQTLERRDWWRNGEIQDYDLLIVDEAHTLREATLDWMAKTNIPTIGLSATPFAAGLGKHYQSVVNVRSTHQLIADGWLVPLEKYAATTIDMTGAKTSGGEWTGKAAEERAIPIIGDICNDWIEHTRKHFGGPVSTIVFSATVAHGEKLCRQFSDRGYRFEQISYRDRDGEERREKLRMLRQGEIHGLVSCEALAKGYDEPAIRCVVMARPYRKSVSSVIQALGRGMRSAPGKKYALLLDHSGNYMRHGAAIEEFWQHGCGALDCGDRGKAPDRPKPEKEPRQCRECGYLLANADNDRCPKCGAALPRRKSNVVERAGKMGKIDDAPPAMDVSKMGDVWALCCTYAASITGKTDTATKKMASGIYKGLMGHWPSPYGQPMRFSRALPAEFCRLADRKRQAYAIRRSYARRKSA